MYKRGMARAVSPQILKSYGRSTTLAARRGAPFAELSTLLQESLAFFVVGRKEMLHSVFSLGRRENKFQEVDVWSVFPRVVRRADTCVLSGNLHLRLSIPQHPCSSFHAYSHPNLPFEHPTCLKTRSEVVRSVVFIQVYVTRRCGGVSCPSGGIVREDTHALGHKAEAGRHEAPPTVLAQTK